MGSVKRWGWEFEGAGPRGNSRRCSTPGRSARWGMASLLGRFLGRDDSAEPAFAALVDRHGRMVLRVCRDVLGDPHEAQDAAQADVLHPRPQGRRDPPARGPAKLAPRHGPTGRLEGPPPVDPPSEARTEGGRGFVAILGRRPLKTAGPSLHEELARLPDRYREPIVLCDLAGLTHEQAAGKLGCPPRTLETRLYRGRERLKDRLVRRGVAPSVALVGVAWAGEARAALPQGWSASTAGASARIVGSRGWAAAGEVPAVAVGMAREHLKEMAMIKLKWVAAAGILIGVAGGGAWSTMVPDGAAIAGGRVPAKPKVEDAAPTPKPKDAFERAYALADGEDLKLLTGPAIEARNEHYQGQWTKIGIGGDPVAQGISVSVFYVWREGELTRTSTVMSLPPKLRDLFGSLMGVQGQEVEGDAALLDSRIAADFIVRAGVSAARLVPQLETILRRDFHLPVRLSLKDAFRDVVVVRGKYRYKKAEELKPAPEGLISGGHRIEIAVGKLGGVANPKLDRFSSGVRFSDLLSDLGQFLGLRVVNEVKEGTNPWFDYCITDFWARKELSPEDRSQVLEKPRRPNRPDLRRGAPSDPSPPGRSVRMRAARMDDGR